MTKCLYFKSLRDIYCYNPDDDTVKKINSQIIMEKDEVIYSKSENLDEKNTILLHPKTDEVEIYLDRNLSSMTLQTTQNCNLRCSYCPYAQNNGKGRNHNEGMMEWDIAKKAIDFLHSHSVNK